MSGRSAVLPEREKEKPHEKPHIHIGQRIVKSAISVGACFLIYVLVGYQGIPLHYRPGGAAVYAALLGKTPGASPSSAPPAPSSAPATACGHSHSATAADPPFSIPPCRLLLRGIPGAMAALYTAVSIHKTNAAYPAWSFENRHGAHRRQQPLIMLCSTGWWTL